MENLELQSAFASQSKLPENVQEICVDDIVYCYISDDTKLNINISGVSTVVDIPKDLIASVVQINFLSIWNVIFIATESSLIVFDITKNQFSSIKCSEKIIQASLNPTQTFIVVLDDLGALSGYSFRLNAEVSGGYQFILIANGLLDKNVPNSVYVGWGAHNTQFKGIKKKEEAIKEIPQEYAKPLMSWRGNGEMFVINYWKENRRFLKVFDANLQPMFESEPYNNLLAPTSFKGQGNFIACASTDGEMNRIVIFEKNCLVKSSFLIPENKGEVKSVQYHHEKHILAVHSESSTESCLNIYLYTNDTWYLKHQLYYPIDGAEKLLQFKWVADLNPSTCKLNVLTSQYFRSLEFTLGTWGVFHDLVAVIHGKEVLFTEFSREVVPPPMASITLKFEKPVNEILHYPSQSIYGFILSNGQKDYYKYENAGFEKVDKLETSAEAANNTMSKFSKIINGEVHDILLNKEQDMLIDGKVEFHNVLSIHVHNDYLLFTHVSRGSYKLSSVRFTEQTISAFKPEICFSREVEQGAKIVCVTDKDQVILSMPRGNLEIITCRLIAIDRIESLLSQNRWSDAVKQIRTQKLNWNLLIDLNKQRFVEHIKDFIEAASTISLLNTIVTEFGTENCLHTMYKAWTSKESAMDQYLLEKSANDSPKIAILGSILKILVELNPLLNLLSIVTLQIKHFSIRAALISVFHCFSLKQEDSCRKAIAQILRYKHSKDVISAVYTLYNIEFLSFVYSACSEDPRVFEPEIEELKTLNQIDLRFIMNVRGKDFENATKYVVRSETKNEAFIEEFIRKHSTHNVAYNNVRPGDIHFKLITNLYADYLALKAKYREAGLILERAGLYEEALNRYKIARYWQKVISLLNLLNVEGDDKKQALRSLAKDLIQHKEVDEGVNILEHHCGDYKAAVEAFVDHKMFQKALCLARQYNANEIIENLIKPTLKKYREDLYDRISEMGNKFSDYTSRLLLLREKKCIKLLRKQMIDEGVEFDGDGTEFETDSVNSEYGSIISKSSMGSFSSGGSRSSTLSSRNRRKMERKKTDLREGGTFEDIALIRQLYLLALDIFAVGQEVTEVCYSLTDEDNFKYGKVLQSGLSDIQGKVLVDIARIWSDTFLNTEVSNKPSVTAVIENRHELDEQFRNPPPLEKLKQDWKLLIFD